jgi:hypothetical protein
VTEVEEKTEFKFSELSASAKKAARDKYRSDDHLGYDWWGYIYKDAVRMGGMLGIEISKTWHAPNDPNRKGYETIDISFSGFCSQGDGASFEGNYRYAPEAIANVVSKTTDEELLRIAQELTLLQLTRRLQGLESFSATIRTSGNYSHSGTMNVEVNSEDEDDEHINVSEDLEDDVTRLMRNFADWIYKYLEVEYDYLTSDKYINERLNEGDDMFDEDGAII